MMSLSRRAATTLLTFVVFILQTACGSGAAPTTSVPLSPTATVAAQSATQPSASQTGCPAAEAQPVAESSTATLGPGNGLLPSSASGERLVLIGTLFAADCTPMAGAVLNVWHTDSTGRYGTEEIECCYFQADVTTDANGRYQLITIRPGNYETAPAHIHVEVNYPQPIPEGVEIVFAGDPNLPADTTGGGYAVVSASRESDAAGPYWFGIVDIVMQTVATASHISPQAAGGPRRFRLLPEQSEASYQISEKFADFASMVTAVGVTGLIEGELQVDVNNLSAQVLTMTVDLRGLKTDDPQRDEKLADDWLVTNDYPFAYFTSTAIANAPAQYTEGAEAVFQLIGDMTIRAVTRSATFDVRARLLGDTLTGIAEGTIRMTDFGIEPPNLLGFVKVEDDVLLKVTFTAQE